MAYLGQGAEGNFTTTNAKDTFSGNGSTTTFTLSQRGTENNVDVFVNNVRQEPNVAYNIEGNGTSLVFTAAPSSGTNNIYVVNRGPAELSATHPSGQALEAYSATISTDLTVDTNTLVVDSTNNRVGIGRSSPSRQLHVSGSGANTRLRVENTTGSNVLDVYAEDGGNSTLNYSSVLTMSESGTERMRILAGGGLTFNGDTAAANALDDYEEGTWTATTDQGTLTSSVSKYIKVGNLVTVTGLVQNFSNRTSTSGVIIRGLPFATGSNDIAIGATLSRYINATGDATALYFGVSRSHIAFYNMNQGSAYDNVRHADLNSTSSNFHFTVTYRAA